MTLHDVLHPAATMQHMLHDVLHPSEIMQQWVEGHVASPLDSIYARIDEDVNA